MYRICFPISNGTFPRVGTATLLEKAFHEAKLLTQASEGMLMMTQLSAIATAMQGNINVEIPTKKISPVSIMALTIADSGERKSTVENLFTKGLKYFQKDQEKIYHSLIEKHELLIDIYNERLRKIKRKIATSNDEADEEVIQQLIQHRKSYPQKPRLPTMIYEDSTVEALLIGLKENSPNAFLGSSEGGVLLKSRVMSNTATINALWSGDEVTVSRKTSESFNLCDARLSVHIMAQHSALKRFLGKSNDDVRGNGFLSRMLVCAPQSTCGYRQTNGFKHEDKAIEEFNQRLYELLQLSWRMRNFKDRRVVVFSNEAKDIWLDIYNDIESKMAPGGMYQCAKDHASKLADNIARVAALIHYFEYSFDTDISVDSLWQAIDLLSYVSNDFMRIFCPPPKHVIDAMELGNWIQPFVNSGIRYLRKNYIRQYGPNCIRNKIHLEAALNHLKYTSPLGEVVFNKSRVIDLNCISPYDSNKLLLDIGSYS
jgi:hypothetical protein